MKELITTCDICGKRISGANEMSMPVKRTVDGSVTGISAEKLNLCYECLTESTNICKEYNKERYYLKANILVRKEVNIIEHGRIIKWEICKKNKKYINSKLEKNLLNG